MTLPAKALPDLFDEEVLGSLNYAENTAAKRLLDAIISILADEFIQTAKQNPDIFKE